MNFIKSFKDKILKSPASDKVKPAIKQLDDVERMIAGVLQERTRAGEHENADTRTNADPASRSYAVASEHGQALTGAETEAARAGTESGAKEQIGKVWEKNGYKRLYINRKDLSALGLDPELAKYKPFVDLNDPDLRVVSKNDAEFNDEAIRKIREAARGENGARIETDLTDRTDKTDVTEKARKPKRRGKCQAEISGNLAS